MFTKKFYTFLCPQAFSFWASLRSQRKFFLAASNHITSSTHRLPLEFQCQRYFSNTMKDCAQITRDNTNDISIEKHNEKAELSSSNPPEENKDIPKKTPKQRRAPKVSNYNKVYGLVLRRVVQSCKIYINLPPAEKKKVVAKSRVCYVRRRLDLLSPEQFQSFKEYIEHIDEYGYNVKLSRVYRSTTSEESHNPIYEGLVPSYMQKEKKIDSEHTVMRISKSQAILFNKKHVSQCLKDKGNGPLMRDLILDFLNKRNKDFKLYLEDDKDEREIGKVSRIQRQPKTKCKAMLINHLDKVRFVFQSLSEE